MKCKRTRGPHTKLRHRRTGRFFFGAKCGYVWTRRACPFRIDPMAAGSAPPPQNRPHPTCACLLFSASRAPGFPKGRAAHEDDRTTNRRVHRLTRRNGRGRVAERPFRERHSKGTGLPARGSPCPGVRIVCAPVARREAIVAARSWVSAPRFTGVRPPRLPCGAFSSGHRTSPPGCRRRFRRTGRPARRRS